MNETRFLIWLTHLFDLGYKKQCLLLDYFGGAEAAWKADNSHYYNIPGITAKNAEKIIATKKKFNPDRYLEALYQRNIRFVSILDTGYPNLLSKIDDPPLGIYIIGEMPGDDAVLLSVVGTRTPSEYGMIMSHTLSSGLAKRGVVIVSGMALGLDRKAHEGCMEAGGKTVAVLGSGVDVCYPPEHLSLYKTIISNGCVLSEYPPGTRPFPRHFPSRNRIISGLSIGTLVIEAGFKSGALITVNHALDQGREVFAVPGNANSKLSQGTNRLIQEGAPLITEAKDVLDCLGIFEQDHTMEVNSVKNILAPNEELVYYCISLDPVGMAEIVEKTGLDTRKVQSALSILEVKKLIRRLPGQRFIR